MAVALTTNAAPADTAEQIIPLHGEHLDVSIKEIVTGEVEVSTITHLQDVAIDEALTSEHADIETVQIGRVVDVAPAIREENGVLIIPVLEEVIVVERRLVLKEEVHIRRHKTTLRHQETVTLRQQEAVVQRTGTAVKTDIPEPEEKLP